MINGKDRSISKDIAQLAQMACILEACAGKPGNVNRWHDFNDARLEDFLISALAIGSAMENAGAVGVGQTIWQAVSDTRRVVASNTNLGIVLLLAPLVCAAIPACAALKAGADMPGMLASEMLASTPAGLAVDGGCAVGAEPTWEAGRLRPRLAQVLQDLTVEDARQAYAAIRLAQPGGLGRAGQADVAGQPEVSLYDAMALAQERDAIAREYVTDYAITFETGYPALKAARDRCGDFPTAIVQAFLTILSRVPDTLIARKEGAGAAERVSGWAGEALSLGGALTLQGRQRLEQLDQALRAEGHRYNPGTTADLTAAAVFLVLLEDRLAGQPVCGGCLHQGCLHPGLGNIPAGGSRPA